MIDNIILILLLSFGYLAISSKILQVNINFKSFRTYIGFISLSIIMFLNIFYVPPFFRWIIIYTSLTLINSLVFSKSLVASCINSFLIYFLFAIAESWVIIFIVSFKIDLEITLIYNIPITIFVFLLTKLSVIKRITNYLMDKKPKFLIGIFIVLLAYSIINFLYVEKTIDGLTLFVFFNISIILFLVLLLKLLLEKNNIERINNNYEILLGTVKNYERLLEQQRIQNHENKNQLLMIKTLVNNEKVNSHIDLILNDSINSDQQLFLIEINNIPFTVIKGFLYYKYLDFKEKDVNLKLEVGSKVKNISEDNLTSKDLADISKIMGVFIDNAVQALDNVKEKEVKINIFKDNNILSITIANEFSGTIDLTKKLVGTTTKGEGHGYGLLLVEDILKKNYKLKNTTEIIRDVFIQNIYIDLDDKKA